MNKENNNDIFEYQKSNKLRFSTAKMYINKYLIKHFKSDFTRKIRQENKINLNLNCYTTNKVIGRYLVISDISNDLPIIWYLDIIDIANKYNTKVDLKVFDEETNFNIHDRALSKRKSQWEDDIDNVDSPENVKDRSAILLNTAEVAEEECNKFYNSCMVLRFKCTNSTDLNKFEKELKKYLKKKNIKPKDARFDYRNMTKASSLSTPKLNGYGSFLTNPNSIAEMIPYIQNMNDLNGYMFGIDLISKLPYIIDLKSTTKSKNILIISSPGDGKTFLAQNLCNEALLAGDKVAVSDVKGNEFTEVCKEVGGKIISLGETNPSCINFLKIYDSYNSSLEYTKKLLCIINQNTSTEAMFLYKTLIEKLYQFYDVSKDNKTSWINSQKIKTSDILRFFVEKFKNSKSIINTFDKKLLLDLEMSLTDYFSPTGDKAYMFENEVSKKEIIEAPMVVYDLSESSSTDIRDYNIRLLFTKYINLIYCMDKTNRKEGQYVLVIDEEGAVVDKETLKIYKEHFALGRSSNQINIFIANGIDKLKTEEGETIVNTSDIVIAGNNRRSVRDFINKQFDLKKSEDIMRDVLKDERYEHSFFIYNALSRRTHSTIFKVMATDEYANSKYFKNVDVVKNYSKTGNK